ncbi:MAG: hypothetical protein PHP98_07560 [Kiritimatiellae bacterium]|nr:hypothetical protein [Kiritimatiellia bacterium]
MIAEKGSSVVADKVEFNKRVEENRRDKPSNSPCGFTGGMERGQR